MQESANKGLNLLKMDSNKRVISKSLSYGRQFQVNMKMEKQLSDIIDNGTIKEKEFLVIKEPGCFADFDLVDQLKFLYKEPSKYFPICDYDMKIYFMENYPEIFARYCDKNTLKKLTKDDYIDPGYYLDVMPQRTFSKEELLAVLNSYAEKECLDFDFSHIDEEMFYKEDMPILDEQNRVEV